MSEIGFVILTHTFPEQTRRLIHRINQLYDFPRIVLHHDFSQSPLTVPPNVELVIPHFVTAWGSYSLVAATLEGLRRLYARDSPEWFIILSGTCYPARNADAVLSQLSNGGCDAYLEYHRIEPGNLVTDRTRALFARYFRWPSSTSIQAIRALHMSGIFRTASFLAPFFERGYSCFAGSQWFSANRRVARYILNRQESLKWLSDYVRKTRIADEVYFQTMLCNEPSIRICNDSFRFYDFEVRGSHPRILEADDLPLILSSGAHFARKVAPSSVILDLLDDHLHLRS